MGIDALSRIIKINPDYAEEHQLAVIDCLEVGILCKELSCTLFSLKKYELHSMVSIINKT